MKPMPQTPAESLLRFVQKYAANAEEVAVRQRRGYRMESWSYAQVAGAANRVARLLESRAVGKGDAVLLWAENSAEWIAVFLGCILCGAVSVPLDHGATAEFAERVAREVNAKLVFCGHAQKRVGDIPSLPLGALSDALAAYDGAPYSSPALRREDTLEIIFTSGTTAEPRGVVISHGNVLANVERLEAEVQKYLRYERWFHPLRFLNVLPLSHVFGQMMGIFIPPMLAGTVVFMESLKPADLLDTIRQERATVLVTVPRFMESLQREIERQEERHGRLAKFRKEFARAEKEHFLWRWWRFRRIRRRIGWRFFAFISGGAALPEELETFWTRLGYGVIQGYGMTETASLISLNHPFRSTKGSIGQVFPGMEVRVDENGEILVRGEGVAKAYRQHGQVQALAEADGWFRTGDLAEQAADGKLYFKGRSKNVMVTPAGMKVYPADLEKALRAQAGVRDCVVLGMERAGNAEPYAVLLMQDGAASAAAAVERANESLAEYQNIRQWLVWPEADFPRTPTQKPILPRIREAIMSAGPGAKTAEAHEDALPALIAQITGRKVEARDRNGDLEKDLQLSSLDRVELLGVLEERYQVDLQEATFQDAQTVEQIEKLIAQGPAERREHAYPTWPQSWVVRALRLLVYYAVSWPATYLMAAPRIRGKENLRGLRGPVLVVANHVTYLDIAWVLAALPARLRHRLATAMDGERLSGMRRPPRTQNIFVWAYLRLKYVLALSLFNVFPLPRQSGFLQSFAFAGNLVDRGWNVLVFPEGQVTEDRKMHEFRPGIGLLAKHLNIPVVPIFLEGLFDLKQAEKIVARPGHVRVTVGRPVEVSPEREPKEIARELEERVRELQER